MSRLREFYYDPFSFFDNLNLRFKRVDLNIFRNYERLRKSILVLSIVCLGAWFVFGFDSTPLQFLDPIMEIIMGKYPLSDFWMRYNVYYGKEMHYSAFVIYGLCYVFLSRHFDKLEIKMSKNVCYSASLTALSIALFEYFWIGCFATFQNQPWVVTWAMPQLRILLQNLIFLIAGIIGVLYMWADSYILNGKEIVGRKYCFNINWKAIALIGLSIFVALFWIYYPFHVDTVNVTLSDGTIWTNNHLFPQTLYTIKTDVGSPVNAGEWFYVPNDLVHGVNTLVKTIWTFTIFYIARLKSLESDQA